MRSIKTKIGIYFSILILLSSITLGLISVQRASDSLTKVAEQSLRSLAFEGAKLVESRIETQKKTLEMISGVVDIQSMDWELQQPILQSEVKRTNFLDIGVVTLDGTAHYSDGTTSQLGDREYIKKALNGQLNVSDLLVSRVTNEPVLMYAAPIESNGKVVGALIGRRDGQALSNITDDTGFGDSGYAYMINGNGIIVAHPDREKVLNQFNPIEEVKHDESQKSVATLFEKILAEKTGVSSYSFEGTHLYAGYAPVEGSDWIVVITAHKNEVLSAIPVIQKNIMLVMIIILLVSIAITYLIGNSITKPIIKIIQHSEKVADLDITEDVSQEFLKNKDEIGSLSKALQSITNSLREIVTEVNNSSEQVASASQELTAASEESATSAEAVARTIEEIAVGASDQAQNTEEGSSKAFLLGEVIEKNQDYMENLNTASNKVTEVVREGLKEIDNLYKITEESNGATKEIYEVILKTNDSSNEIGQASSVIASIAEQTNLLALNATIEAARAGDSGRGFAVVAEEIRKLAEQSANSTEAINKIVSELQNNAHNAVKTMERVSTISREQTNSVSNSKGKYGLIAEAMGDAQRAVEQLNVSGETMEKMKNEILDTLQNLSSIAEENSAATEEVTASMEEQATSIEEVAGASLSLSNLAQNLQSVIMRFKF